MQSQGLKDKAVRGVAWYGGSRIVIQLVSWVMTIAVARVLAPSDYGVFGMALLYVGLVDLLNELGFGAAIVQKEKITDGDLQTLFWFGCATGLFFYGITVLVAPLLAAFFKQTALVGILWVLGLSFIITALRTVPWNILTRAVDFKKRSMAEVVGNLMAATVTVVLAYRGWGVWALAWGFLARNTLMTAQVYAQTRWCPRWEFSWRCLRAIFSFSLCASGSRTSWYLTEAAPPFVIGKILGAQALGYYNLAHRLTIDVSGRLLSVLNHVAFPVYSRLQQQPEKLKAYYLKTVQMLSGINFPLLLGLFLVADDLIPLILTDKWLPMVPVFKMLCWAGIFLLIHGLVFPVIMAKGRADLAFRYNLLFLVVLSAGFLSGTWFGLLGVCWVWLTVFPLLTILWLAQTKRIIGYQWIELWRALKPAVVSTAVMLAVGLVTKSVFLSAASPILRLVIVIVLGASVYLACFMGLFPQRFRQAVDLLRPTKTAATAA